jgi:regulator of cell morphogenesis and NO signaling
MNEHDSAGSLLRAIRRVANDFQTPADACFRFNALYAGLQELESDLHRHIHLENNVLFPLTVKMEQSLLEGAPDRVTPAKKL